MNSARKAGRPAARFRIAVGSALAAALLAGCAGAGGMDRIASASAKAEKASARDAERSVAQAERSVELQPGDASLRVNLGQTYMKAGRFESAITAFNDAMELGDESPRTALSLALANIAIGRNDEAVTILNDWREGIPAVDAGLAYALAGETARGTAILADAVRSGDSTPKARQNFAYALALDGRWREARIMMSQDLAPDVINERISQWAALASEGNSRISMAALLGTPVRSDSGQPQRLALVAPVVPVAAPGSPVETHADAPVPNAMLAEAAPVAEPAAALVAPPMLAAAEPVASPESAPAVAALATPGFVSMPVVQALPASPVREKRVVLAPAVRKAAASSPAAKNGTHLVQLGSFTSEQAARRAWDVYTAQNAALRHYRLTIIPATVNGKNYWRVAAAGFDAKTAQGMCGSIKARGGSCLAYAGPGKTAPGERGGPQMARRR